MASRIQMELACESGNNVIGKDDDVNKHDSGLLGKVKSINPNVAQDKLCPANSNGLTKTNAELRRELEGYKHREKVYKRKMHKAKFELLTFQEVVRQYCTKLKKVRTLVMAGICCEDVLFENSDARLEDIIKLVYQFYTNKFSSEEDATLEEVLFMVCEVTFRRDFLNLRL